MGNDARTFFQTIFGKNPPGGHVVLWDNMSTQSFPAHQIDLIAEAATARGETKEVYFSPGLQAVAPPGTAHGEARTVTALPGLWLDINLAGPTFAPSKNKLPNEKQAHILIAHLPLMPTLIMLTDRGEIAFWLFQEPWTLCTPSENLAVQELSYRFQRHAIEMAEEMGFHLEDTSALNHGLRIPGTKNIGNFWRSQVKMNVFPPERRYSREEFENFLSPVTNPNPAFDTGGLNLEQDFPLADLAQIEEKCAVMAQCRDSTVVLPEPIWFAQATILGRCEDGMKHFHERRQPYPGYDHADSQAELERAITYSPRTCDSISNDLGFQSLCEACLFSKHLGSPIRLGVMPPLSLARIIVKVMLKSASRAPGAPFSPEAIEALILVSMHDKASALNVWYELKRRKIPLKKVDEAIRSQRASVALKFGEQPYRVFKNAIFYLKPTLSGMVDVQLSNFSAEIFEETTKDDGAEQTKLFCIRGKLCSGEDLPIIEVPSALFGNLKWITDNYGALAIVYPNGHSHLPAAIQTLSTKIVYREIMAHIGWRKIGDNWAYLSNSGALGHSGLIEGVEVDLSSQSMQEFDLEPAAAEELAGAIKASLTYLDLAPAHIAYSLLAGIYRAPLGEVLPIDHSLYISGPTGAGKSEIAAMAQAHFGSCFHGKNLPAYWASTESSLEKQAFLAKDAVIIIDDFNPIGTQNDLAAYHKKADLVLRGQGNLAGKQLLKTDGALKPEYFPRGLIISTGEDIPPGQSLRARMFILELGQSDVNHDILTEIQTNAASGLLAKAMAGYVQWLAKKIDTFRETLPSRKHELRRQGLSTTRTHSRTPDIIASLMLGFEVFLEYALESGAMLADEAEHLRQQAWENINLAASFQTELIEGECPCQRFLDLIVDAMTSGIGYLLGVDGNHPEDPSIYGWYGSLSDSGQMDWKPQGKMLGWVEGSDVFLNPATTFGIAQTLAVKQGNPLNVGPKLLWKLMLGKNLIASHEKGSSTKRLTKVTGRPRTLHILADILYPQQQP